MANGTESRRSLELFNKHAGAKLDIVASVDALDAIKLAGAGLSVDLRIRLQTRRRSLQQD